MEVQTTHEPRSKSYYCSLCFRPITPDDHQIVIVPGDGMNWAAIITDSDPEMLNRSRHERVHADCMLEPEHYYTLRHWGLSRDFIRQINKRTRLVNLGAKIAVYGLIIAVAAGIYGLITWLFS